MSRSFLFSLILVCCAVRVFSQAVSLNALKLQREEFQNNIRNYQDSLAEINFLIAEMESGKNTEISNLLAEKKYLRYLQNFRQPTVNFSRRASSNGESVASKSSTSVSKPSFDRAKGQSGGIVKQKTLHGNLEGGSVPFVMMVLVLMLRDGVRVLTMAGSAIGW